MQRILRKSRRSSMLNKRDFPKIHFYDQDFVDIYDKTWNWLSDYWIDPSSGEQSADGLFIYPMNGKYILDQSEAIFSSFFLVYSNRNFPANKNIDYFYERQEENGAIRWKYDTKTNTPITTMENPEGIGFPLFAWAEFNLYHKSANKRRVKDVMPILEKYMVKLEEGTRIYSIVTSTLAYFYQKKQMWEQQERYLLLSAISDERSAIRENNSLRSLSEILMSRGENDNAYRYLYQAISEAQFYGSRLRIMQVGRMAPQVLQLYDMERTQTQQRTNLFLGIISFVSLILAGIIIYTLILYRKKHAAGLQIIEMNKVLAHHTEEIENVNTQMKEANRIKEEYIGRFLELSSLLLSNTEQRMKQLNRLARDRKLEELYAELKTMEPVNTGIRTFHSHFDTAFLNIYPRFINEVNNLLTPENRFAYDDTSTTKHLTTELRILALIRLDITDNQKIAGILRSSITTIYTYRSKLKAKAINKDTFEDDVRKISTY